MSHVISSAADGASGVYAIDVDGDGDVDVLSASQNDDKVAWYENNGTQNFTPHVISDVADGARGVHAADVDGDGDVDVLSAAFEEHRVTWYENDGEQNFLPHGVGEESWPLVGATATSVHSSYPASNLTDESAWSYWRSATLAAGQTVTVTVDLGQSQSVASVYLDFYASYERAESFDLQVCAEQSSGCTTVVQVTGNEQHALSLDFESVAGRYVRLANMVSAGTALRLREFKPYASGTHVHGPFTVFAADVTGDGHVDVLTASRLDDKVLLFENDGAQNFPVGLSRPMQTTPGPFLRPMWTGTTIWTCCPLPLVTIKSLGTKTTATKTSRRTCWAMGRGRWRAPRPPTPIRPTLSPT